MANQYNDEQGHREGLIFDRMRANDQSTVGSNFWFGNDKNGAANARAALETQGQAAQGRTGPSLAGTVSGQQADAMGQIADVSRGEQGLVLNALGQQATGQGYDPAQAQLQQALQASQGYQNSVAHGATGYDLAASNREAQWGNAGLASQAAQQSNVLRAQQQAYGRDAYAQMAEKMRGADQTSRGMLQDYAQQQASMDDAQRARNDAMTQFYTGESDRIRQAQNAASQNYEKQEAANLTDQANFDFNQQKYNDDMARRYAGTAVDATGTYIAHTATSDPSAPQKKRNPEDPWADY